MRLFRDARNVTSMALVAGLSAAVRSVLVLRLVGPTVIGIWKTAMLLYTAGELASLGVLRGMSTRVPILEGQGQHEESDRTAVTAATFMGLVGLTLAAAGLAASFWLSNPDYRLALRLMAVVLLLAQLHVFLRELAGARHLFGLRARECLLAAAVEFVAFVGLGWLFGLAGLGAATILSILIPAAYLWRGNRLRFRPRLEFGRLRRMIATGLPVTAGETAFDWMRRLDQFMIALLLGPTAVGYYGISLLIVDFSVFLTRQGLSQVVAPHLLKELGRVGSHLLVAGIYEAPARLISYVLPPLLGAAALALPPVIGLLLPQYGPGVEAAQISLWTIFFVALHYGVAPFLIASQQIPKMLQMYAVVMPAGALAYLLVLRSGLGLTAVAWTTLAVVAVLATGEIYLAKRSCRQGLGEILPHVGSLYLPLAAAMTLTRVVGLLGTGQWGPGVQILCEVLLLLALYAPVLVAYESRFLLLRAVSQGE
jgi:O-antigen/teichoic acid export membrane protein